MSVLAIIKDNIVISLLEHSNLTYWLYTAMF